MELGHTEGFVRVAEPDEEEVVVHGGRSRRKQKQAEAEAEVEEKLKLKQKLKLEMRGEIPAARQGVS